MPSAGVSSVPSSSVIFCSGVERVEAVLRAATLTRTTLPAYGTPVEDDEVAHLDVSDTGADALDDARRLVPEQERVLVVDSAVAVGQVGVAHTARCNGDHYPRWHRDRES